MSKGKKTAISVFFIAFAFGLNITGISPILGVLNEKYTEYGTSVVQLLQTLPYFLLMFGSIMVGWWTTKTSKKKIVQAGLFLIGVCGILPFFSDSFLLLFLSRLLIGFGFGIVSPLNTAIIAETFEEKDRAGYMGLHVVGMGVGTMAGNMLGAMLLGWGYRFFYLVYLIAFLSLLSVRFLLAETPPGAVDKSGNGKLNLAVYAISCASFVHTLFINAYSTNISIYILQNVTENTAAAGMATTVNAAFALLMGALFSKIAGFFKKYTVAASVFAAAAGYGVLLTVPGMAGVYAASGLCGISLSCFMAGCSTLISSAVETEAVARASGVFSVIGGIGGLIAPIFMGNAALAVFGENTAVNQFTVAFWGMLLLGTAALFAALKKKNGKQ